MSDDLIERLRKPHRQIHRSTGRVVEKSSPAIQHEAADALAAKDTALSEMKDELEALKKALGPFIEASAQAVATGRRPHDFVIIEDFHTAARALAPSIQDDGGER